MAAACIFGECAFNNLKFRSANFDQLRRIHNRRRLSFSWNGSDRRSSVQRTVICQNRKTFAEDFSGCLQIRGSFKKWNFIETKSCFTESETHFRRKKLLWCCYVRLNLLFSINGLRLINSCGQLTLQKAS